MSIDGCSAPTIFGSTLALAATSPARQFPVPSLSATRPPATPARFPTPPGTSHPAGDKSCLVVKAFQPLRATPAESPAPENIPADSAAPPASLQTPPPPEKSPWQSTASQSPLDSPIRPPSPTIPLQTTLPAAMAIYNAQQ